MKTLIINADIVTEDEVFRGEVLIEDGKIVDVGPNLECTATVAYSDYSESSDTEVIDAEGKLLLPGAVDVHTHMDLDVGFTRAIDNFYSGTVAAACGGTTTIVDHMAFAHDDVSLMHQVEEYHKLADGNAVIDYGFHGVLQKMNDAKLHEMKEISEREGITSWKAYLTYGDNMINDAWMFKILRAANEYGLVIPAHCENDGVVETLKSEYGTAGHVQPAYHPLSRPAGAEAEAVSRFLHLAKLAGEAPAYVVHLSSAEGLTEVEKVRCLGQRHVGVETCTQYLALTDDMYADDKQGLKAIMSPPLRKQFDIDRLWGALARDGIIDTIATDHCPFTFADQKQLGASDFRKCPNGAPGVEERLSVVYSEGVATGRITLSQMVRYLCTEPARMFGIYPKKGAIMKGADADLVIMDPDAKRVMTFADMHTKGDYTCYEGMEITGKIEKVFAGGKLIVEDNKFLGRRGDGRYLKRGTSSLVE